MSETTNPTNTTGTTPTMTPEDRQRLSDLAGKVKDACRAGEDAARAGLGHYRQAGEDLAQARQQCERTGLKWGFWVERNCGISQQHANNLIRLHANWSKVEAHVAVEGPLSLREALAVLRGGGKSRTKTRPRPGPLTAGRVKEVFLKHGIKASVRRLIEAFKELGVKVKPEEDERQEGNAA